MATVNSNDVLASITSYIQTNNRPCPAHFLVDKFGDDVAETITNLKKEKKIEGLRGRNGGIIIAGMTIDRKKSNNNFIAASKIDVSVEDDSTSELEVVSLPL